MNELKQLKFSDRQYPAYLCEVMKNGKTKYGIIYKGDENHIIYENIGNVLSTGERKELKELGYITYITTCSFDENVSSSLQREFLKEVEPINVFYKNNKTYFTLPLYVQVCSFEQAVFSLLKEREEPSDN